MNFLLQPKKYKSLMADEGSKAIMDKTIAFFEKMGKTRLPRRLQQEGLVP